MKQLTEQEKQNLTNAASVVLKERGWMNLHQESDYIVGTRPNGKENIAAVFVIDQDTKEWSYMVSK